MTNHGVSVYGATGHTGRFVASELERRGVSVRRIGRRSPANALARDGEPNVWRSASIDHPETLDGAFEGTEAVINCAGPFLDTAPAVIESALRVGAHYLDIAAEQRSVRQSLATYHSEARDKGLVVLPAMAFYGGLADLLASWICAELSVVDEILIGIALDYWHPTGGTRRTGERNTARRLVVSRGRLALASAAAAGRSWHFPAPFGDVAVTSVPLSEIITISRHIAATRIESFMNEAPLKDLRNTDTPPPTSTESSGRSTQTFAMDVRASGAGKSRRIIASGHDIYAVTAPIVAEACMRIVTGRSAKGGAFAPGELFDSRDFLSALRSDIHVEFPVEP